MNWNVVFITKRTYKWTWGITNKHNLKKYRRRSRNYTRGFSVCWLDDDAFMALATADPTIPIIRAISSGPIVIVFVVFEPTSDTDGPGSSGPELLGPSSSSWMVFRRDGTLTDDRASWYVRPGGSRKRVWALPWMALMTRHSRGCLGAGATWEQSTSSGVNCLDLIMNSGPLNGISFGFFAVHILIYAFSLQ